METEETIKARYEKIVAEMKKLETEHLYWLTDKWKTLMAQKTLLMDILF